MPSLVESICARCARNSITEAWCELSGGNGCVLFRGPEHQSEINREGIWLEALDRNPERHLLEADSDDTAAVRIDLNRPMPEILAELTKHPVKTRVLLTGTMVVARDIAHAKLKAKLDAGEALPEYFKNHPVYYAGPAKKPDGLPSGSFGPTTSQRMDPYVAPFQAEGASMVILGKGNRSQQVVDACQTHGGFYLGSIGGPAAILCPAKYQARRRA